MRPYIFLFFLFHCLLSRGLAQEVDIKPFIKAWSIADTSQTHKAEETYSYLKKKHNVGEFHQIVNQSYAYLKNNPDERLWVRTTMFYVFGKIELAIWRKENRPKDAALIFECIKIANKLNDDQLKAELYVLYAELFPNTSNHVLYNLKAIALQEKVGLTHFSFVANRYYSVGYGLYLNEDFRQSVNYGVQGLKYLLSKNDQNEGTYSRLYILMNDIVGASYFRLNKIDSATHYYQNIIDTLTRKPDPDVEVQQIWLAIAKGNIGRALGLQGQEDKAIPLIEGYLQTSLRLKSYNNVTSSENILGAIYLKSKAYKKAQIAFRNAYKYAKKANSLRDENLSSKGLADVFRATNQSDSAFVYYALNQTYRDSLIEKINRGKLSAIQANIAFDNMEADLQIANNVIQTQRLNRNYILLAIFLFTIIALLFYNRKMLQQRNLTASLAYKQKALEQEANQAKAEIKSFIDNIADKNKLIGDLQHKLTKDSEPLNQSLLQYTLVTDTEWERFRVEFSKAYPFFLPEIQKILPTISPAEERLAALLCLKINPNQIANTLGISKDSVSRSKRRLKQRLNLSPQIPLEEFICKLV